MRRKVHPTSCAMIRDTKNNIPRRKAHNNFLNGQDSQLQCLPPLGARRRAAPLAIVADIVVVVVVAVAIVVVAVAAIVWSTCPLGEFCSRAPKPIPPWAGGSPPRPPTRKRQQRQPRRRQRRRRRSAASLQSGHPKRHASTRHIYGTYLRSQNAEQLRENGTPNWRSHHALRALPMATRHAPAQRVDATDGNTARPRPRTASNCWAPGAAASDRARGCHRSRGPPSRAL